MSTHYSNAQDPISLAEWASKAAGKLTMKYGAGDVVPVLVYRGMSGVASATALMLALEGKARLGKRPRYPYVACYIRKCHELSHGTLVEWGWVGKYCETTPREAVFVDDFICSGETVRACYAGMFMHHEMRRAAWSSETLCLVSKCMSHPAGWMELGSYSWLPF